jgi:hypothetical protein
MAVGRHGRSDLALAQSPACMSRKRRGANAKTPLNPLRQPRRLVLIDKVWLQLTLLDHVLTANLTDHSAGSNSRECDVALRKAHPFLPC